MTHHILVLSHVHEGGEWIATSRLIVAIQKSLKSPQFSLVGLIDNYIPERPPEFQQATYISSGHTNPPLSYYKNLLLNIINIRAAIHKTLMTEKDIDCFFCTNFLMILCCLGMGKTRKIPMLFYFHGIQSIPFVSYKNINHREIATKILERIAFLCSTVIIVPAKSAIQQVRSALSIIGQYKKIYIIPNAAPSSYFKGPNRTSLNTFKNKYGIRKKSKIILYSGRMSVRKGLENLLTSISMLLPSENRLMAVFAYPETSCDDQLLQSLRQRAQQLGIARQTLFIGGLPENQLMKLYHVSDVTVLASEIETAPLSMLESLACGTVFLGTKTGNMPTVLTSIDSKLLLENDSPQEICTKLRYWLHISSSKKQDMQRKCRSVAGGYSIDRSVTEFHHLMSKIG